MSISLLQRLGLTRLSDYLRLEEESHERELECYMLEMECEELRRNVKRLEEEVSRLTPRAEEGEATSSVDNLLTAKKIRLERRVKPKGAEKKEERGEAVKKATNKATIKKGTIKTKKK